MEVKNVSLQPVFPFQVQVYIFHFHDYRRTSMQYAAFQSAACRRLYSTCMPTWVQKVPAGEDLAKQLRSASAEDEGQQGQPNMVFL